MTWKASFCSGHSFEPVVDRDALGGRPLPGDTAVAMRVGVVALGVLLALPPASVLAAPGGGQAGRGRARQLEAHSLRAGPGVRPQGARASRRSSRRTPTKRPRSPMLWQTYEGRGRNLLDPDDFYRKVGREDLAASYRALDGAEAAPGDRRPGLDGRVAVRAQGPPRGLRAGGRGPDHVHRRLRRRPSAGWVEGGGRARRGAQRCAFEPPRPALAHRGRRRRRRRRARRLRGRARHLRAVVHRLRRPHDLRERRPRQVIAPLAAVPGQGQEDARPPSLSTG